MIREELNKFINAKREMLYQIELEITKLLILIDSDMRSVPSGSQFKISTSCMKEYIDFIDELLEDCRSFINGYIDAQRGAFYQLMLDQSFNDGWCSLDESTESRDSEF